MLSKLYKQLTVLEEDPDRRYALYQRRIDLLGPLKRDLNYQAYSAFIQEFQIEFSEMYGELYD